MARSLIRDNKRGLLRLTFRVGFTFGQNSSFDQSNRYGGISGNGFSTVSANLQNYSKGPPRSILLQKLERALKEHQVDEAWETYKDFKRLYGFPDQLPVANLINESSYSSDSKNLRRACDLVLTIANEKPVLLSHEMMTKLAISLARAQIPVPASRVLRVMLEKRSLPSLDILRMVFLHLVKNETGTYLASNILEEICYRLHKSAQTELTKPDVVIFNLVLDACVRFGNTLKGQQIIELMALIGVVADAHTAMIIARIHEMNGMRDELKKFKDWVDMVPVTCVYHYLQFYDSLLSLHFKFNDMDSASALLLDLCGYREVERGRKEQQNLCSVSIGSDKIKMGLKLQFLPQQLHKDFVYKVNNKHELIVHKNGKFVLSQKGLAKLIVGYKRSGRINELSKLLIRVESMLSSPENSSPCCDAIDACVHLEWLQTAHDILDDLESENYCVRESSYTSLLTAYYSKDMLREAEGLVRQINRVGLSTNLSDVEDKTTLDMKVASDLAHSISQNMREDDKAVPVLVHEYNSTIYFFTKAKMIEDARNTYQKMQKMKIDPNASTFFYMICGYSDLGMYREITVLWGDIKRSMNNRNRAYNRDLYEFVVLNLIRGGYFERVMEIVGFMMENNMFVDKWWYRSEFLKFHRDLYRTLNADDAKDEVQKRRLEFVKAFRKFVGIN